MECSPPLKVISAMRQPYRQVSVSSPGKLVVSGEYAVLYGASALSLAVNRRAHCSLLVRDEGHWKLRSSPPFWNETESLQDLVSKNRTDSLSATLKWFVEHDKLPEHCSLHMNTERFFSKQRKLGLGSSAGVLVTLYASLATLSALPMQVEDVLRIYSATQAQGSGVDVLTSYSGGLVQVKEQTCTSVELPAGIYLDIYSVGFSTETASMIGRFRKGFDNLPVSLQDSFIAAADTAADSLTDKNEFFNALQNFIKIYRSVDSKSKLAIWSAQHETMHELALDVGVLYKPSGAGGGDIGVAVATEQQRLKALRHKVVDLPVTLLDLQRDSNGVRVEKTA